MKKTFIQDFIKGSIGLVVMNAMISLLVYPFLQARLGIESQGQILFYMSLINLLAGAFGSAANYGRLKMETRHKKTENSPYNIFLLISGLISILILLLSAILKKDTAGVPFVMIVIVAFLTILRYYADVNYRISLRYTSFMFYYLCIALGYGLGMLLFLWIPLWPLIFIPGEIFGILYSVFTGITWKKPFFKKSVFEKETMTLLFPLAGAYFLSDFVGASDRLLFPLLLPNADTLTSLYYYASVVGKIASLLSTPLNGVLAGHLTKKEGGLTKRTFSRFVLLLLAGILVLTVLSTVGSHLFVWLFYRNYYEDVRSLFFIANLGQVFFFACNTLMVVVLRYTDVKNQVITGIIYILIYFTVTVPLILKMGLLGMALGILIVNALKFSVFTILAYRQLPKKESSNENKSD